MENQYCKVGAVSPIIGGGEALSILELRYKNFLEKAAHVAAVDGQLGDFFKRKAQQLKKILEDLA